MAEIRFIGMGNDYMFRAVLQKSESILKHLLATLLDINMSDIDSCVILNPIELGRSIDAKDCVLDIKLCLNNKAVINIELQMYFEEYWVERSLVYWSRAYDTVKVGDDYDLLQPTCHIGILNQTLFEDHPEFYADYRILNSKDYYPYGDVLRIVILDLSLLNKLTKEDEDENPELVRWAKIFKAKTMKEIEALTKGEEALENMELLLREMSEEEKIREQCFAREDYEKRMRGQLKSGIHQGKRDSIQKIVKKLGKTVDEAMDILDIPEEERDKYRSELN